MEYHHTCPQCGSEFTARRKDKAHCSSRCKERARKPRPALYSRVCSRCSIDYATSRVVSLYCSRKCAAIAVGPARGKLLRRTDPFCVVEGCDRNAHCGQLCLMHYKRVKRNGSIQAERNRRPFGMSIEEWFWRHVEKTDSCWLWTGNIAHKRGGYGTMWDGKQKIRAHHFLVGKPGPGMEWDHLCCNTGCVKPNHLELVTPAENRKRVRRR